MSQVISHSTSLARSVWFLTELARLTAYSLVVFGFSVLFYGVFLIYVWPLILTPFVAELFLIKSSSTSCSVWKALWFRFIALMVGNMLWYFAYVLPIQFGGEDRVGGDFMFAWLILAPEMWIASIAWRLNRRFISSRIRTIR